MKDILLELVKKTSTEIPNDILKYLETAHKTEADGTSAKNAMKTILQNIDMAKEKFGPICQDTGMIKFYVHCPKGFDQISFMKAAEDAVSTATAKGYLRQNSVDSITGKNTGNNLGKGTPQFHFVQWEKHEVEINCMLKGGGCENVGGQYTLPCELKEFNSVRAGRDLEGVKLAILHGVWSAQGKGCSPGFVGICIGGDRAHSLEIAKEQLLRDVYDVNPDPVLSKLEKECMDILNDSNIGPMGFGGKSTVMGIKIADRNRLPASFFVSIAYACWAHRRKTVILDNNLKIKQWKE